MMRTTRRHWAAALLGLALVACGGGGGGGGEGGGGPVPGGAPIGPPAAAVSLGNSAADAAEAVRFAVAGAESLAARHVSMSAFAALTDVSVAGNVTAPLAAARAAHTQRADGRQTVLAVRNVGCLQVVNGPCVGSAVIDTNIPETASNILAGQYLDVTFNGVSGYAAAQPVTLNGRLRIEFLTAVSAGNTALRGVATRLTFDALSGAVAGVAYGPVSEVVDVEIGATGGVTITGSGRRYSAIGSIEVADLSHFVIGDGSVRAEFGGRSGHADLTLTGWHSSAGKPVVGSLAWVSAGGIRIGARALSATATTVTYGVNIVLADGSTTRYTVTATYPSGGGAPVYVAVVGG